MRLENFDAVLLLPRLRIQNANAISSPMTWGFPAPSAFTGFVHALQLRMSQAGYDIRFGGAGIVCHGFEPQVFMPPGRRTQVFRLSRNPVNKEGATAAIVEEGRTHLEVSLLITVSGDDCAGTEAKCMALAAEIFNCAEGMRLAGGSIIPHPERHKHLPQWIDWDRTNHEKCAKDYRSLRRRLVPGFALVSRAPLLAEHLATLQTAEPEATSLDALLDLCRLNIEPETPEPAQDADNAKASWTVRRSYRGWLVPLPIGYAAISPLYAGGAVQNARDEETPFRFVESVLSLGEWISPHRASQLEQLLWHHHAQPDAGSYLLHNAYSPDESNNN